MLDKIGIEINTYAKMFPLEPSLVNFTVFLNKEQKSIEAYYPQLDQMDFYRFVHVYVRLHMSVGCSYYFSGLKVSALAQLPRNSYESNKHLHK